MLIATDHSIKSENKGINTNKNYKLFQYLHWKLCSINLPSESLSDKKIVKIIGDLPTF